MRILNLVMAIIYTVIYGLVLLVSLIDGDSEMLFGVILLSGPVIVNWITYDNLKK